MALEGRLPARIGAMSVICVVCERETVPAEETRVRSNVRAFREEAFRYFRCEHCRTIHAHDDVDLAHYYGKYPFHALVMDWRLRAMYARQLARLVDAG